MIRSAVILACTAVLALANPTAAHVGSPNVYYEGPAGPYTVRVVLRPPSAIPGIAEATVRVAGENLEVSIAATAASAPAASAAPPQPALPVPGAAEMYSAELWLLEAGAYAVRVRVAGPAGEGEAVVPVNAVNRAPSRMPWSTAALLIAVALSLIAGAAPLAAVVAPGSARLAAVGSAAIVAVGILLLLRQSLAYDRAFRSEGLFESMPVQAETLLSGGRRYVLLSRQPDERGSRVWPRLVTDHGKLMHTFLIRDGSLDAFAHVHPQPTEQGDFIVATPDLPAGDYLLYADITREDGLSETLSTTFELLAAPTDPAGDPPLVSPDPDDSHSVVSAVGTEPLATAARAAIGDGYEMIWENPELSSDPAQEELRFAVVDGAGRPVRLTAYMGMMGHAAVRRLDGRVFAHLHPVGSISMASQEVLARADAGADPHAGHAGMDHSKHAGHAGMDHSMHAGHAGMDHSMHAGHAGHDPHAAHRAATVEESSVRFPYEFPLTGPFRIWVQVKVGDTVRTGVFDTQVTEVR